MIMKLDDSPQDTTETGDDVSGEKTLAMIKPDAIDKAEEIEEFIKKEGFEILQKNNLDRLDREQASELYADHIEKVFFQDLLDYVTSGAVQIMVLSGENAVERWRTVIGPTNVLEAKTLQPQSLRAKYGSGEFKNAVHGSRDKVSAEREVFLFFPDMVASPTVTGQAAKVYLAQNVNPTLLQGLTELCRLKPTDPIVWLADWLLVNNPNRNPAPPTDDAAQDVN